MPDLIIKPELGDSVFECFEEAYKGMCADRTMRTATFSINGLKVTISKEQD